MSNELKFKGTARCSWVRANNGIYQAIYEPEPNVHGMEYLLANLRTGRGTPKLWKMYLIEIQPAFPHETERKG